MRRKSSCSFLALAFWIVHHQMWVRKVWSHQFQQLSEAGQGTKESFNEKSRSICLSTRHLLMVIRCRQTRYSLFRIPYRSHSQYNLPYCIEDGNVEDGPELSQKAVWYDRSKHRHEVTKCNESMVQNRAIIFAILQNLIQKKNQDGWK